MTWQLWLVHAKVSKSTFGVTSTLVLTNERWLHEIIDWQQELVVGWNRKDQTLIDSKWVYKLKHNLAGNEARIFKARLVARSFTQEKYVNYNKVYLLEAKYDTICFVCKLVTMFNLIMNQMDVVRTFLYEYIQEKIYLRQPVGFEFKVKWMLVCKFRNH